MAKSIDRRIVLTNLARDILELINKERCTLTAAAKQLNVRGSATASNAIKRALKDNELDALLLEYPNAEEALTKVATKHRAVSVKAQALAMPMRPAVSAEHPKEIDPKDLLPTLQSKLCLALSYIDRYNLTQAKLSELNSTVKTLFEMGQVMQGKPTSISRGESAKQLKELVPALLREAERRGMVRGGEVIDVPKAPKPRKRLSDAMFKDPGKGSSRASKTGGTQADPPGGFDSGPVKPSAQSNFSKILNDFQE